MTNSYLILIHAIFAYTALFLGTYVLLSRKGTEKHKGLGKLWMAFMCIVAFTGLFITEINPPHFSVIHLLIPFTLFSICMAIYGAKMYGITRNRRYYKMHRRYVVGVYIGLCTAGAFSFFPGRHTPKLLGKALKFFTT